MRVLWFTMTPGLYDVVNTGSWIEALEKIFIKYLPDIKLGLVFEHTSDNTKVEKDGIAYYPINVKRTGSPRKNYELLRPYYLQAINDFKPDIVQCFGTERWHYGLLAKEVNIPFVIHIMGFMNIYDVMDERVIHPMDYWKYFGYNPFKVWINRRAERTVRKENQDLEREVMACNYYFMGRTEWDKNIVKYYAPKEAKYFHCAEAIRDEIYSADKRWEYHNRKKLRLLTVGNAGSLKGNEIMLQTAWLLKNRFDIDFEWLYTSDAYKMSFFEKLNGIRCEDVNIRLIGRLNATEIAAQLAEADFYIHPSIIDNSPNTVCEAQLMGTPVIAANTGGLPQIVEDGKTGWLYPYSEPHTLAFKIMNLAGQKDYLTLVSENELEMSHKRHAPEKLAKTIKGIYDNILANEV